MFFLQPKMKFHIHLLSFLTAIIHFIRVLAEIFKKLNSVRKDTENGIWTSKLVLNEGEDGTDTAFEVFEDGELNLSSSDAEDCSWASEQPASEEYDNRGSALSAVGDEGNSNDYIENSDDACWTSELTSKQIGEETEIKLSAFDDEEIPNDYTENLDDACWTQELTSKQDGEETEMKMSASVDEEYLNDWFENSDDACCTSELTSKQDDEETKIKLSATEGEGKQNIYNKNTEGYCWTSELMHSHQDGFEISVTASEYKEKVNVVYKDSEDACSKSERILHEDRRAESDLPPFEDKAENLNDLCTNLEENYRTSELMLNFPDKETESKMLAFEDEAGNLNDLNKKFEDNKISRMSNLQVGETKSNGTSFAGEDDPNSFDAGPLMCDLFEKQLFTDVHFYSKGKTPFLSAHRAVLAAKCSIFENMLFGNQNNEIVGMEIDVQIEDLVPCHVFTSIVRYFYTNDIEFSDDYTVLEIFAAAKVFQIPRLIDQCKLYIESMQITENNVCSIFEVCSARHIDGLKTRCIRYIQKNTFHVISSKDFEKCTLITVQQICKLEYLNLNSEVELLEAVLRWISVQKMPEQAKKEFTRCLLKYIRVLSFTPKEFSNVIQRHPDLWTPEEGLQILIYLNNRSPDNFKKLPKWCNKNLSFSQMDHKNSQRPIFQEYPEGGKIKIFLKPTKKQQEVSELTALLHMRCVKGFHQIKSIKFSFESIADEGCVLEIKINISPNGPAFLKKHCVKSRESTYSFKKAVTVYTFQTVQIEVTAETSQSCKFHQFYRWYNDPKWDFECFFISKPKTGRLYFISEIEYEPVAPPLMTTRGDGFKSSGN